MTMRWRLLVLLLGLVLLAACSPASATTESRTAYRGQLRGAVFDPPRPLNDFSVMSTTGEEFTLSEHRGEVMLLYFGYRSCPDFCPTTFADLYQVYSAVGEPADKLKIIFVTIDPERDTLESLRQYTQFFHDDFLALRGEGETLQQLENQFGVVATRRNVGTSALSYMFDHTASVFLIGPDGQLEAQYLYGTRYQDIVHDLELILPTL